MTAKRQRVKRNTKAVLGGKDDEDGEEGNPDKEEQEARSEEEEAEVDEFDDEEENPDYDNNYFDDGADEEDEEGAGAGEVAFPLRIFPLLSLIRCTQARERTINRSTRRKYTAALLLFRFLTTSLLASTSVSHRPNNVVVQENRNTFPCTIL
jgi:hypothetical protein